MLVHAEGWGCVCWCMLRDWGCVCWCMLREWGCVCWCMLRGGAVYVGAC